ncbi:MAG: FIST C-terminal domain-containing protein, partial [Alphaproteobacteria bacterium]|nr:FIST C-terminal domain-containing protein [Alphaproteobacteria bacterium]
LRESTGVTDWVSASGYGVISANQEHFGVDGATALILDLPSEGYRLFSGDADAGAKLAANHADWIAEATMPLAITHVDPRHADAMAAIEGLAESTGGFLIGGLTAASGDAPHQSGGASSTGGDCLSGVAISPMAIEVATALSQGCSPLGEAHTVTRSQDNILVELDGRPALDVLIEEIGPELASDLQRIGGIIFAAIPVAGSDTADYTVRNLVGIDPQHKVVAIADTVPEGDPVLFCRRDRDSAVDDMRRMTDDLKRRVGNRAIRGGLYISCAARGPNQFAEPERETDIIRETLGDFPMAGFFANGEISRDRVYAYTGVLTLFL